MLMAIYDRAERDVIQLAKAVLEKLKAYKCSDFSPLVVP